MLILPVCPGSHAVTSVCQAWISVPVASDCDQNLFQKDAVDAWKKSDIFRGCAMQCKQNETQLEGDHHSGPQSW